MHFNIESVKTILRDHYNLAGNVSQLPGELDYNFFIDADGQRYIFKIANANEIQENLLLQHAVINHLVNSSFGLTISRIVKTKNNEEIIKLIDENSNPRFARLLTWIDGRVFAKVNPHSPELLHRLGEMLGNLSKSLQGFDHSAAHRFMKWDPSQATWIKQHIDKFEDERKAIVDHFYSLFEEAQKHFASLRMSVNYNDANDYNVLVSNEASDLRVPGVIDFGDVVYTHTINELAIAIAYAVMDKPNPIEAACHIVKGYHQSFPLKEEELKVLFPMIATRLIISVVCSELNRLEHPENVYLQISDRPAWDLLEKLKDTHPDFAEACFRNSCGLAPSPSEHAFKEWISNQPKFISPIEYKTSSWLDLSVGSLDLGNTHDVFHADRLDKIITTLVAEADVDVVFGKYDEARAIYATPAYELPTNDGPTWRTVHIGLDFFCAEGTEVKAALDGIVHSFANNAADRDYGPTIILEHRVSKELTFYTLYGHLNTECLTGLSIGKKIQAGETIATVGHKNENGNWTPHLHFQIMLSMLGKQGDFPGVCIPQECEVWKSLCPDPMLLVSGKNSPEVKVYSSDEIVSYRKQHIGKNLSISYKNPIKMVRGAGQFLIDDTGRRYLDTVNNVAHLGHEHPRVVAAGQRQMAVLNTNTRYLHENLMKFTEKLLAKMPKELNVAFIVNSGSEANELALRLAKTYTGQQDMIVSEVGYHGNTNACMDISSYKFDGPGGKGKQPHIHAVPIPDAYRGLYRNETAGIQYAQHVKTAIDEMASHHKKPAALIFESVISCGGQVELPKDFLKEAYRYTRAAGGVCIADEVQTGCGRAGDFYWAFQQHNVVPDIVTIGKPIGNGHPLGVVVTTQVIADAFKNGMEYFNTFGGNPVSCAIGLEVLNVIEEEGLQQNAKSVGEYLKSNLKSLMNEFGIIGDVRGPGLFIGIELVKSRETKEAATSQASYFANRMRDKSILMSTDGPYNNVLKIKPPIIFSKSDSDFLLEMMRLVLKEDAMKI